MTEQTVKQLDALSTHLRARRGAILQEWRKAAEADPSQTTVSVLTRAQFNDHIPATAPQSRVQQAGEGVGLSIVKRLCELLDASVELASSPETGSTFRVLFPRSYQPIQNEPKNESADAR